MATIIIVEDEEELRENLLDLLEFKEHNVIPYTTSEDLLANLDQVQPDLILLDYQLPGKNGIEAIPLIKEINATVPVALVTASSLPRTLEEAKKNGADRIILKPYSQVEMLQAVEEMLG